MNYLQRLEVMADKAIAEARPRIRAAVLERMATDPEESFTTVQILVITEMHGDMVMFLTYADEILASRQHDVISQSDRLAFIAGTVWTFNCRFLLAVQEVTLAAFKARAEEALRQQSAMRRRRRRDDDGGGLW
jgi:hypothetical protein